MTLDPSKEDASSLEKGQDDHVSDAGLTLTSDDEKRAFAAADVSWDPAEERALVRRLDLRIVPLITLLYLCNFIDRTNIGNAKVAGLEKDSKLVGYQYNIGLSVFYIVYALTEVPSNLLLKRIGATVWIPTLVLAFGGVCVATAFIKNFGGFMAVRMCLGLAEGGVMPGIAYYLSMWYTRDELALRIGIFVSASSLSGAFGGLLATAFLSVHQIDGLPHGQWRNIFLFEGVITIVVALLGYVLLPRAPESNRFLSEREKTIAMERLRTGNAGINAAEKTDFALIKRAFFNMNTMVCAMGFLLCNITVQGISLFMPTLLAGMGYKGIQSQLHTVPPYIVASVWSIFVAYGCQRTSRRGIWCLITTPFAILGSCMLIATSKRSVGYAGIFFLAMGVFPLGPLFLTWGTNNAAPYTTKAVTSALIVSIGSFGPVISAWAYLPRDGPRYITGLSIQLGSQILIVIFTAFLMFWNIRENRLRKLGRRDHRLKVDESIVTTLGNRHPKFRLTI